MKSMIETFCEFLLSACVICLIDYLFESVYVANFKIAFLVAVVLALLNKIVKPLIELISLPLTIMSFGLFRLIINGFILKLATIILYPDIQISSFFMMIVTSVCISILYSLLGIDHD